MICFSPEDLAMIKNGPGERRRFLDLELCQLDKVYLHNISNYNKIVNQRNNLLKQIGFDSALKDTLDIWDMQMVDYGRKVSTFPKPKQSPEIWSFSKAPTTPPA